LHVRRNGSSIDINRANDDLAEPFGERAQVLPVGVFGMGRST
jgi:hypothetical protein